MSLSSEASLLPARRRITWANPWLERGAPGSYRVRAVLFEFEVHQISRRRVLNIVDDGIEIVRGLHLVFPLLHSLEPRIVQALNDSSPLATLSCLDRHFVLQTLRC